MSARPQPLRGQLVVGRRDHQSLTPERPARTPDNVTAFQPRPFIDDIAIEFGPRELLAEYFVLANQACRARGVDVVFAPMREVKAINETNRDTWLPLFPVFDPDYGADEDNSFCLLGLNGQGDVVVTQAARFYNLAGSDLQRAAEDLSFFYDDVPARIAAGETCQVSAPSARNIRGRVVFSGGGWYRPDYRKKGFFEILPRISRAYALTKWSSDYTMTMMAEKVVAGGRNRAAGYENIEWDVQMRNSPLGDIRLAVLWMNTDFLVDDLTAAVRDLRPQVNSLVENRAG